MTKQRATTIQQRFGFMDNDLKTPKHDEILLWLNNNLEDIVKRLFGYKDTWDEDDVAELRSKAENSINSRLQYLLDENNRIAGLLEELDAKQQLHALRSYEEKYQADYRKNISENIKKIGDLQQCLSFEEPPLKDFEEAEVYWEYPIMTGKDNKYIVGFVDLRLEYDCRLNISITENWKWERPYWSVSGPFKAVNFEIKTTIPSLGELVRQIQMYREYIRGWFVVVSPDDKFADALKSQNIKFLKYKETPVQF